MRGTVLEATRQYKITAILRGIGNDRISQVIDALYAGGIRLLEITFNQKLETKLADTTMAIRYARETYGDAMHVGAGTVMSVEELEAAYEAGAELVKLFPAGNLGLAYCKAVMAPINHVPMIAVGGVDDKNLGEFLAAGFVGAGIGSSLTDKKMIAEKNFQGLTRLAERYMKAAGL